jgi:deoxyribose-phosphate aldolase
MTRDEVARTIDHALLKPELTIDEVLAGCAVAGDAGVATVCCRPVDVPRCVAALAGSSVGVSTVIGFPHGANLTATKVFEAQRAIEQGAAELDMVLQIGALCSGHLAAVLADIAGVVDAAGDAAIVKVILETGFLTDDQKVAACELAEEAGAEYVKTSTGFGPAVATLEDVRLMRATVSRDVKVKASGGIRTLGELLAFVDAGAARIGTSSTEAILAEL